MQCAETHAELSVMSEVRQASINRVGEEKRERKRLPVQMRAGGKIKRQREKERRESMRCDEGRRLGVGDAVWLGVGGGGCNNRRVLEEVGGMRLGHQGYGVRGRVLSAGWLELVMSVVVEIELVCLQEFLQNKENLMAIVVKVVCERMPEYCYVWLNP